MTALTLPGAIPNLLRRGSPGFRLALGDASRQEAILVHAIADRPQLYGGDGSELCAEIRSGPLVWWPVRSLALDLTDATGRAHAAWWLEAQPVWSNVYRRSEGAWWFGERFGIPYLGSGSFCAAARPRRAPWDFRWAIVVPPLANLVDDGRLLPDGSRWVDAEALRLVCLHVAGVSA